MLLLLHRVVEAVLHDGHGGVGAVDAVQRLLRERLDGGHLLIQRALQITHLVLQQRDVTLQFHNLFARAESERGQREKYDSDTRQTHSSSCVPRDGFRPPRGF